MSSRQIRVGDKFDKFLQEAHNQLKKAFVRNGIRKAKISSADVTDYIYDKFIAPRKSKLKKVLDFEIIR